ncbi:ferrochelatase [Bisgaardia hudsonensis]|uniref:Ferrochelatase n=1 Tax=Bisgaardia hudsonensis TaxID=109472 RepID=A0A4R2N0Y0_9PAST|nr:ferrochelatase [Bisgaardia hudsonensis]QLB13224.1 ferrochelatase [Bisgaardia hudsonensis]TCP13197.1 ferrochelatase [Bisgaardia hudsonensis]
MKNKQQKIGIILTNLGTPDTATASAVSRYLWQFLTDPRVVDLPRWKWFPLLKGVILPRRSKKVAQKYQSIWTEQGSPLLEISKQQQTKLQQYLIQQDINAVVELAMTYGNPSMEKAVQNLLDQQVDQLIVLPLFPQYSSSTTGAVLDAFADVLKHKRNIPSFKFIHSYHLDEHYINALANSIKERMKSDEFLVFSFHGIPLRYENNGDYYREHCKQTVIAIVDKLGLTENQWALSFQSRFGKEEWIQPYTDVLIETINQQQAVQKIAVICPGFASDCLETLEEIEVENREIFLNNGGISFQYIPALNDSKDHIEMLGRLILSQLES